MNDTGVKRRRGLALFFLCYIAYSCTYVVRLNFSVASVLLEAAGTLTKVQIGIIGSIFSFTYSAAKIPAGYLGDRYPTKLLICGGLAVAGLANLIIGLNTTFATFCIFWFLNACGQSLLWGPVLRTISEIYGPERSRTLCQFTSSSVAFGSVLGFVTASFISARLGAVMCFIIPAFVTAGMAVLVLVLVPGQDRREYLAPKDENGAERHVTPGQLLHDRSFLRISGPALFHGIIKDNVNVWIAVYFADHFGINVESIAGYVFFAPVMGFAGRLLYPVAVRRFRGRELNVVATGFAVTAASAAILMIRSVPPLAAVAGFGLISAMISMVNVHILADFPSDYADRGGLSFVSSLMDVITYAGAGLGSLVFGYMISASGFNAMFITWIAVCVISILIILPAIRAHKK